jgi:Cu2+-exporting ATPase
VSAQVDGRTTRLGRADWVARIAPPASLPGRDGDGSWILLGDDGGPLAWISLRSQLREGAAQALARLRELGAETTLVSGDPSRGEVDRVARALGIDERRSGASPGEKVAVLHARPVPGEIVAAVGDGVNDAPMLAGAEVSIAMAGGSDLARTSADAVLLGDRLEVLPEAVALARRTRSVIRQNLIWAAAYNALVLPLAVTGQLPPYLAAIGMSASSLVVVGNALRLRSGRERGGA